MFNALKYIKSLEDVGFPREQAEAQVQLVMDSFQDNVATKSDMADFKAVVKSEVADIRSEIAKFKSEIKSEIAEFRAEMAELKTDLIFRLGGLIVICAGILSILIKS